MPAGFLGCGPPEGPTRAPPEKGGSDLASEAPCGSDANTASPIWGAGEAQAGHGGPLWDRSAQPPGEAIGTASVLLCASETFHNEAFL